MLQLSNSEKPPSYLARNAYHFLDFISTLLLSFTTSMADFLSPPLSLLPSLSFQFQGQNLILNMNDHGFVVCAYNRTTEKVDRFLANEAKGT